MSEKWLTLLRDRPCVELIIFSGSLQALLFLQANCWKIGLKTMNPSKRVFKTFGPTPSRINSVVTSAQTVFSLTRHMYFLENLLRRSSSCSYVCFIWLEFSSYMATCSCPWGRAFSSVKRLHSWMEILRSHRCHARPNLHLQEIPVFQPKFAKSQCKSAMGCAFATHDVNCTVSGLEMGQNKRFVQCDVRRRKSSVRCDAFSLRFFAFVAEIHCGVGPRCKHHRKCDALMWWT